MGRVSPRCRSEVHRRDGSGEVGNGKPGTGTRERENRKSNYMRIKVASAGVIPRHSPFRGTHVVFLSRGVNKPIFVRVDNFILHDSLLVNKTTKAMRKKIKDVFAKLRKIIKDNTDEKTICFIDRGSWSDPKSLFTGSC